MDIIISEELIERLTQQPNNEYWSNITMPILTLMTLIVSAVSIVLYNRSLNLLKEQNKSHLAVIEDKVIRERFDNLVKYFPAQRYNVPNCYAWLGKNNLVTEDVFLGNFNGAYFFRFYHTLVNSFNKSESYRDFLFDNKIPTHLEVAELSSVLAEANDFVKETFERFEIVMNLVEIVKESNLTKTQKDMQLELIYGNFVVEYDRLLRLCSQDYKNNLKTHIVYRWDFFIFDGSEPIKYNSVFAMHNADRIREFIQENFEYSLLNNSL